jgi:hypothetical protein
MSDEIPLHPRLTLYYGGDPALKELAEEAFEGVLDRPALQCSHDQAVILCKRHRDLSLMCAECFGLHWQAVHDLAMDAVCEVCGEVGRTGSYLVHHYEGEALYFVFERVCSTCGELNQG